MAPWPPRRQLRRDEVVRVDGDLHLDQDQNSGVLNNAASLSTVGLEPANFAFITKSGTPHAPPGPLDQTEGTFTPNAATDLFMKSGDALRVDIHDGAAGLTVIVHDLTTDESGSMTASAANGFAQVLYEPSSTACHEAQDTFRPMYATSSEHTRVPWAAHSSNVAFSDEIGHLEYCNAVAAQGGACTSNGEASLDGDDTSCFARRPVSEGNDEHVRWKLRRRVRAAPVQLLPEPEPCHSSPHEQLPERPLVQSLPGLDRAHSVSKSALGALFAFYGGGTTTRGTFDHPIGHGLWGVQSSPSTIPDTCT
jgi:hypothetical protein